MERRGESRCAIQVDSWASFAEVEVLITDGAPGLSLGSNNIATDSRRRDWIAGMEFGHAYARDSLPVDQRGLAVEVVRLETNPVDSSSVSVAFATCFAIWNAVAYQVKKPPYFDEQICAFVFPVFRGMD